MDCIKFIIIIIIVIITKISKNVYWLFYIFVQFVAKCDEVLVDMNNIITKQIPFITVKAAC